MSYFTKAFDLSYIASVRVNNYIFRPHIYNTNNKWNLASYNMVFYLYLQLVWLRNYFYISFDLFKKMQYILNLNTSELKIQTFLLIFSGFSTHLKYSKSVKLLFKFKIRCFPNYLVIRNCRLHFIRFYFIRFFFLEDFISFCVFIIYYLI